MQAIAQRLEVALNCLRLTKHIIEIEEETGASTATISRINRELNYGADGYKLVPKKIRYNRVIGDS